MSLQSLQRFDRVAFSRRSGLAAAVLSLAVVAVYVFVFTPYQNFLYSDMRGFWVRAMDRLAGKEHIDSQFEVWPPLGHVFIAEFFRGLRTIGLQSLIRLETLLALNIVVFSVSVYAFHRLAAQWFARSGFLAAAVLLYAIGFPALYFHAFLLSENIAVPLLVTAIAVAACGEGWVAVIGSALLFGVGTIIRPSIGPYGLAFVLMYFARHRLGRAFLGRAAVFSAVFFFIVFLGIAEVSHISQDKLNGLSANGGVDFFTAISKCHRIELNYEGWHFFIIDPAFSLKPENGTYYFEVPFYQQGYYFKLGWEFLKRKPALLWGNFAFWRDLFFSRMLPSRPDAPGFRLLMPVWDAMKFIMFASLGLYAWAWRKLGKNTPVWCLLASLVPLTFIPCFLFTGEPRYTYAIMFAFSLLFFKLLEWTCSADWRRWLKRLLIYVAILAAATGAVQGAMLLLKPRLPSTLLITLKPENATGAAKTLSFRAGRLLFPYNGQTDGLKQADVKQPEATQPTAISAHAQMEIAGTAERQIQFEVCSSWPFELFIDGNLTTQETECDYVKEVPCIINLTPGMHEIEAICHYSPGRPGGFAISYSTQENAWWYRNTLGVDAGPVHFIPLPESR